MTSGRTVIVALVVLAALAPATSLAQSDGSCSFPLQRTDASGETVRVAENPERVVTLNPSAAQTMAEIGAWDRMVGATKHAANLQGFRDIENVSGAGETINNEEVVGLEPDLVLAPNTVQNDTVRALRSANVTIYRFRQAQSIDDVTGKIRVIGQLTGECQGAADTIEWMQQRLAVVDEATAAADRPTAVYVFFGYSAGDGTFINGLIERAGATNGAAASIDGYQQLSEEVLLEVDPDWLILNTDWTDLPDTAGYNRISAVQEDQIVVVNTNHLNRPGPRVVYAVETMAKAFHPDAYAAANATGTPDPETITTASTSTATETATPTTEGADGRGFGIVVALLALLTGSLAAHGQP